MRPSALTLWPLMHEFELGSGVLIFKVGKSRGSIFRNPIFDGWALQEPGAYHTEASDNARWKLQR
jgi:hypothetical protein